MKPHILGLLILLLIPLASGAVIKGNVYDFSLEEVEAIVTINTNPEQKMVAKGFYSFEVQPGTYLIKAEQFSYGVIESSTEEEITIDIQGEFVRDIILFPDVGIEDTEIGGDVVEPEEIYEKKTSKLLAWIIFLVILVMAYYLYKTMPKPHSKSEHKLDKDAENILNFITKHKRTTQKEIRKEFPHSEAKISLIIAELEEKKLVKKIKKGRGNIIIRT